MNFCQIINPSYETTWFHERIATVLERALENTRQGKKTRIILSIPPRHGKLIADSVPVLTNNGFKNHGDLKIGDYVFHPSGKQIKVIAVSEKDTASITVKLSNGENIKVHPNHEWTVYDRTKQKYITVETGYLMSQKFYSGNRSRFQLQNIEAVQMDEKELPLDPYFFGAWLGDGTSKKPAITSEFKDTAIIDRIPYKYTNVSVHKITGVPTYYYGFQSIADSLRKLKCFGDKHIPDIYKQSSINQRLELLAGLIDTDGSTDNKSRIRIVTVSRKLADDIMEIITSLGMRPYLMTQDPHTSSSGIVGKQVTYSVGFQPTMEIPVALNRKKINRIPKQTRIGIEEIIEDVHEQGNCIQVDSNDGLYLVGKKLIPTHNSQLASIYFPAWALGKYPELKFILSTYGAELSEEIGMKTRDTISNEDYQSIFDGTQLKADTKSKAKWMTNKGGSYTAVGIGGAITGKGGNCFTGDTLVYTDKGYKRIDTLDQSSGKVLSYNHETNRTEWKNILASAKREMRGLVQIKTSSGRIIKCTPEHQIFIKGKGYIRADSLEPGQELFRISPNEKNSSFNGMFLLFKKLLTRKVRGSEVVQEKSKGFLLFSRMFKKASFNKKQKEMRDVWRTGVSKVTQILREKRVQEIYEKTRSEGMFNMSTQISTNKSSIKDMLKTLFSRFTLIKNEGCKKSKLQTWSWFRCIPSRVLPSKKEDCFTRREPMSGMWVSLGHDLSSHRSQPKEQHNGKFDNAMQELSLNTPRIKSDTVSSIERLSYKENVYDIQVEDNHNFFAFDILVSNCLIIDDPHKDRAEAESENARRVVWDYYRSTLYSRLEGLGAIIVIMQRWRQDDLVGLLLEEDEKIKKENPEMAENWELIEFPAIAEQDEYDEKGNLLRKEGMVLWESKYPMEFLQLIRQQSPYFWASQYQQNPILAETQEFKKELFRYYDVEALEGKYLRYYTLIDPAISQKASADNTVVLTIAKEVNGPNIYRIKEDAGKFTPAQTVDLIFQHQNEYRSEVWIETIAYQAALKFMIEEERRKRQQYFVLKELKSQTKKEERIRGLLGLYQAGVIWHRAVGDLDYEYELLAFPRGRRDDRADTCAYLLQVISNTASSATTRQYKPKWLSYGKKK